MRAIQSNSSKSSDKLEVTIVSDTLSTHGNNLGGISISTESDNVLYDTVLQSANKMSTNVATVVELETLFPTASLLISG